MERFDPLSGPCQHHTFGNYFYNPELALYMDDDQFGGAVPGIPQAFTHPTRELTGVRFRERGKAVSGP